MFVISNPGSCCSCSPMQIPMFVRFHECRVAYSCRCRRPVLSIGIRIQLIIYFLTSGKIDFVEHYEVE